MRPLKYLEVISGLLTTFCMGLFFLTVPRVLASALGDELAPLCRVVAIVSGSVRAAWRLDRQP